MPVELSPTITLYLREDWGALRPRPMVDQGWNAHQAFIHHTADSSAGLDTLSEQIARMRFYQRLHMGLEGGHEAWSDVGYHFVVFPPFRTRAGTEVPARVMQGRARSCVPAAQEGHNRGTLAVCLVGNYNVEQVDRNSRYAIEVILDRYRQLETVGGHRDVWGTECPGDHLYADLDQIADATDLRRYRRVRGALPTEPTWLDPVMR